MIEDLQAAGLPAPSVIRPAKIATIDAMHANRLGRLARPVFEKVLDAIAGTLGLVRSRG